MKRFILLCAATTLVAASTCAQGLTWESVTTGMGREHMSTFYYMPRMFKMSTSDGMDMIFLLDKQLIVNVDRNKKTYSEMTFGELEAGMKKVSGAMDAKMAELREQMKGMPEEQRKMMEKMMGKMGGGDQGAISVEKTGEKKTVSGYACTKYIVSQGGDEIVTMWVTKDIAGFDAMRRDMEEFGERMAALTPKFGKAMGEGMKKVDGFPMQSETSGIISVVKTVDKRSTPLSEFSVPAGYTKVKSELDKGMEQLMHEGKN